jgi:DNA-binding GntR family transcriptional regulator
MLTVVAVPGYEINTYAAEPSYRQLAAQLRADIENGVIPPGRPLPSITSLVQDTGLAVATVRRSIAILVAEGLAHTVPGRGTYARGG